MSLKNKWNKFFNEGHERTIRTKKNVFYSLILKGIGILIGFAYFPLSLTYLGQEKFGIFLTLVSMIDWFAEFDVGIGSGLRNKLGESIAEKDYTKAQEYVSTAYYVLASIFSGIFILFIGISFFLPWADWLQADPSLQFEISLLAVFMLAALAIRFVSSLIYEIFYALQQTAKVNLYTLLTKVLFLTILLILVYTTEESLLLFGAAKTMTFALVPLFVGFFFFQGAYKKFRPKFSLANRAVFKSLFSLGIQYFIIKMAMLVIHKTNNFLIAGYVSLDEVPQYEAAFKYLSIFLIFFMILTNQLWAANVEAYQKKDYTWMRKNMQDVLKIWLGTSVASIGMVFISPWVYEFWLNGKMHVPFMLTVMVALSIVLTTWVNMFNLVLNGTGKIRMQMFTWLGASLLNIPVSIFFATTLGMGTIGIVFGTVVCLIPLAILAPIQVYKILNQTESGIWGK